MSHTIVTLLCAYGICFGLMNDKAAWFTEILRRIPVGKDITGRNVFARLLECPYCTGFHAGYIAWFIVHWHVLVFKPSVGMAGELIATAFASSAMCYLLDVTAEWLESWRESK